MFKWLQKRTEEENNKTARIHIRLLVLLIIVVAIAGALWKIGDPADTQDFDSVDMSSEETVIETYPVSYSIVSNPVYVKKSENEAYQFINTHDSLDEEWFVKTGDEGSVVLIFPDTSSLLMEENTEIQLQSIGEDETDAISIFQLLGETWSKVMSDDRDVYEVATDTVVAAVRGTEFFVAIDEAGEYIVGVEEGDVDAIVVNPEKPSDRTRAVRLKVRDQITLKKDHAADYTKDGLKEMVTKIQKRPDARSEIQECVRDHFDASARDKTEYNRVLRNCVRQKVDEEQHSVIERIKSGAERIANNAVERVSDPVTETVTNTVGASVVLDVSRLGIQKNEKTGNFDVAFTLDEPVSNMVLKRTHANGRSDYTSLNAMRIRVENFIPNEEYRVTLCISVLGAKKCFDEEARSFRITERGIPVIE